MKHAAMVLALTAALATTAHAGGNLPTGGDLPGASCSYVGKTPQRLGGDLPSGGDLTGSRMGRIIGLVTLMLSFAVKRALPD